MTDDPDYPNEGYDEFVTAVEEGVPYYLECANGHGQLPPRAICPDCGSREFVEEPLPESGEIATYTITGVASPNFAEDTPYVAAVADFGPVRLTGQVRGVDHDEVAVGDVVGIDVGESETTGDRVLVFRPR